MSELPIIHSGNTNGDRSLLSSKYIVAPAAIPGAMSVKASIDKNLYQSSMEETSSPDIRARPASKQKNPMNAR